MLAQHGNGLELKACDERPGDAVVQDIGKPSCGMGPVSRRAA